MVALVDVVVDESRKQIVGDRDGVEIAGEMKVHLLHGYDLGVAASRSATLNTERWAQGWLAKGEHSLLVQELEALGQADRNGGFALTEWCRVDGSHENVFSAWWTHLCEGTQFDLGDTPAAGFDVSIRDPHIVCDVGDWSESCFSSDFEIGFHPATIHTPLGACRAGTTTNPKLRENGEHDHAHRWGDSRRRRQQPHGQIQVFVGG